MMLCKLSLGNIRRSLRDYAIYFFTLVIGVSVFYVFNAIGEQAVMMRVLESRNELIVLLKNMLSGVSVFVSGVLGLLIVYASRFLMKRRHREFALYMLLGMNKGSISAILFLETMIIGLGSLVAGLLFGIGLSQLMSALVANMFAADMTSYQFFVSRNAIGKTILNFAVMYLIVIVFNSFIVSKMKLIDLLSSGKKSEQITLRNPILCIIIFVFATCALGYAYYQVGWKFQDLTEHTIVIYIAIGAVSTFMIFWSVSGLLLQILMRMKGMYFRGLNAFTFRQISSKVNTMVMSMTVICLMLFVTICTLSSSFSVRNSMNANLNRLCPAEIEVEYREYSDSALSELTYGDLTEFYNEYGYDLTEYLADYTHFHSYYDETFTFASFLGDRLEEITDQFPFLLYDNPFDCYRLSDYNALMRLYGREELEMNEGEYILLCNFKSMKTLLDDVLEEGYPITVFGTQLYSRYGDCQDGYIDLATQSINAGLFILPDDIPDITAVRSDYLIGNYRAETAQERAEIEQIVTEMEQDVHERYLRKKEQNPEGNYSDLGVITKIEISENSIGIGAVVAFLGLYIGLVFLIVCGAILALKELSERLDSVNRYRILRNIGADETEIRKSLYREAGVFFLFPLVLACIHSFFGMKFAVNVLEIFGTEKMWSSIGSTVLILLVIYGGYFLITCYSSEQIIKERS